MRWEPVNRTSFVPQLDAQQPFTNGPTWVLTAGGFATASYGCTRTYIPYAHDGSISLGNLAQRSLGYTLLQLSCPHSCDARYPKNTRAWPSQKNEYNILVDYYGFHVHPD